MVALALKKQMPISNGNDKNGSLLDKGITAIEATADSPALVDLKDFKTRP